MSAGSSSVKGQGYPYTKRRSQVPVISFFLHPLYDHDKQLHHNASPPCLPATALDPDRPYEHVFQKKNRHPCGGLLILCQ